jgi:peptidoglycan/xylan/chitin deacetylase (PgdA/CDA1 family)
VGNCLVTTSWDDGHRLDQRLADLLARYGLAGTFYVAPRNRELVPADRLGDQQIRELSASFEIGSHTLTHAPLTGIGVAEARQEIGASKAYLEDLTGRPVDTFCYPRGMFSAVHPGLVREAGYTYARTVRRFATTAPPDRFQAGTTLETHRHPLPRLPVDLSRVARWARFNPVTVARSLDWEYLAKRMFDRALAEGGVYHLWGHSWVIERFGDWERTERVFAYLSGRPGAAYLTNGELARTLADPA